MVLSRSQISKYEEIIVQAFKKETFIASVSASIADIIEKQMKMITEHYENKINLLENEVVSLKKECDKLQKQGEERADYVEQYSRRNNLREFGVKEAEKGNTEDVMTDISKTKLKINVTSSHIDRCHRVGLKKPNSYRPIIIKFTAYEHKSEGYKLKSKFKGSKIFIKEDLTRLRANQVKRLSEKYGKSNVWMRDGVLFYKNKNQIEKSSPVLDFERELKLSAMDTSDAKERNNFGETSSISTLSSDSDSNISPAEGNNSMSNNIKHLIKSFEARTTLENDSRSPYGTPRRKVRSDQKLSPQEKLEELQNHLKGTLERCQSTTEQSTKRNGVYESGRRASDVDEKKLRSVTSRFEIYVEAAKVFSIRNMNKKHLFHCCLLVGLDGQHPYIKSKFPSDVEVPAHIEKFCFPDSEDHRINYSAKQQCYSLVITDESGDRIYGYCRRVLPEGSTCCLPLAYCILTKHRAPRFYKKILEELESHHGRPDKQRENLINEFYKLEFPKPGHSVRLDLENIILNDIKYFGADLRNDHVHNNNVENRKSNDSDTINSYEVISHFCSHGMLKSIDKENEEKRIGVCTTCSKGTTELVLTLHQDVRYEETDLKMLCETLDVAVLQKVFENLLLEKKVIFASCHLSKLSSCIEAIQSVLYPFSWPHAFIPVLPKTRWEIVEAPAPLICGVLSPSVVNDYTIEDAIVVDLDTNEILLESDDGMKILPDSSVKSWRKGLQLANSIPTSDNEHNVLLSDAFIRVFINTCGHYKEFISNGMFDKDGFKDFPKGKGTKRFLRWFTETTMFYLFIEAVLGNTDSFYIFDSRIKIYSSQDATLILEKMRDWKKL